MPLYEFECDKCGRLITEFYDMNNLGKPKCCGDVRRKYSPAYTVVDFRDGFDVGLGKYFNTARERNNHIAERNIRRIKA